MNQTNQNERQPYSERRVCLVIPTYNEAGNIERLLSMIYSPTNTVTHVEQDIDLHVLVVDDSSPDGTAEIVKKMQKYNRSIHLMVRSEKNGLGAAYIAGMRYALRRMRPDIVFEMDADLSHDPQYLVPMIQQVRRGADFVIGSRYIPGGAIPDDWGAKRKLISKSANTFARIVLRMNVHDCTSGFRAIRASSLRMLDLDQLKTKGYGFQISLLELARKNKLRITETPIIFIDRTMGESKMSLSDIFEEGIFVMKTGIASAFFDWRSAKRAPAAAKENLPAVQSQPPPDLAAIDYALGDYYTTGLQDRSYVKNESSARDNKASL